MLQIVTGMYFRDAVPRRSTLHRAVFYTNSTTLRSEPIELPVGRLLYDTSWGDAVSTVTVEATEELEAERPDGQPEVVVSTGGHELLDDLTAVVRFALDVSITRSSYQLERIVPGVRQGQPYMRGPAGILARTFDPNVYIPPESFEDVRDLMSKLLALERPGFDTAMRAIRRVVDASFLVGDDPTSAYTQYVAALESLTPVATYPDPETGWDRYDGKKRKIIDATLVDLSTRQADAVRGAVMRIDQLSLRARFAACTLAHVTPEFFRKEAIGSLRPIRAVDLPRALNIAYEFRSRNVHTLQTLVPELWNATMRADTLPFEGVPALSLQGLKRLARHVIREFIRRAPTGVDESFDYRAHLPGQIRARWAPQYWIQAPGGLTPERAPEVVEGFIELLLPHLGGHAEAEPLPDMRPVLDRCESLLASESALGVRQPLSLLYLLWHTVMAPELHRPDAEAHSHQYARDLDDPSMYGFVIRVLTEHEIEWTTPELLTLITKRTASLTRRKGTDVPLPSRMDAALLIAGAQAVWDDDREQALTMLGHAVELVPGDTSLIALETSANADVKPKVDLLAFVALSGPWAPEQGAAVDEHDVAAQPADSDEEKAPAPAANQSAAPGSIGGEAHGGDAGITGPRPPGWNDYG